MRDVASHRLKRSMRGALTATAVAAAVTITSAPAIAEPPLPDNSSDTLEQLHDLSRKAEKLTEKYHRATDDHKARLAALEQAKAAAAKAEQAADQARDEEAKFRDKVDRLTSSAYQGARLNELSALLVSESPGAFLDRASMLDALAKDNNKAIEALSAATERAEAAERRADESRKKAARAAADAARIKKELSGKKAAMEDQIDKVKEHLADLNEQQKESLSSGSNTDYEFSGGAGAAAQAVQAALSKQGAPYVWGAEGPSQFDCSGLMQWAYKQAGVSIPRSSSAQSQTGKSVSSSELKPGDMVFYYSPVSHVAMYVGNGKAVHASTAGEPVKVDSYRDIGPVNGMRRVAG